MSRLNFIFSVLLFGGNYAIRIPRQSTFSFSLLYLRFLSISVIINTSAQAVD